MLTKEEIKKVRMGIVTVSMSNVLELIKSGGAKPTILSNGYIASLSLDVMNERLRILHISVSNTKGNTDIEIAQKIADDIIGKGNKMMGPMNLKNVIHFMKIEQENTMVDLMNDIDDKRK